MTTRKKGRGQRAYVPAGLEKKILGGEETGGTTSKNSRSYSTVTQPRERQNQQTRDTKGQALR